MSKVENKEIIADLLQRVSSGPDNCPEFLLHTLRPLNSQEFVFPSKLECPVDTEISKHSMYNEGDPAVIEFYAIRIRHVPSDLPAVLSKSLAAFINQGAMLSWYVFEFEHEEDEIFLLGLWGNESVYGLCTSNQLPELALSKIDRQQARWMDTLRKAINGLYTLHPQLQEYSSK